MWVEVRISNKKKMGITVDLLPPENGLIAIGHCLTFMYTRNSVSKGLLSLCKLLTVPLVGLPFPNYHFARGINLTCYTLFSKNIFDSINFIIKFNINYF